MAELFAYLYCHPPKDAVLAFPLLEHPLTIPDSFIGLSTFPISPPPDAARRQCPWRAPAVPDCSAEAFACGGLLQQRAHGIRKTEAPISFFFFSHNQLSMHRRAYSGDRSA